MFSASAKPSLKAMNLWFRQWLSSWPLLPPEPPPLPLDGWRDKACGDVRPHNRFEGPLTHLRRRWLLSPALSPCVLSSTSFVLLTKFDSMLAFIILASDLYVYNHSLWFKFKHPDTFILIFGQFLGKREKCYTCTFDDQTALVLRHKLTNCLSCHHSIMMIWS